VSVVEMELANVVNLSCTLQVVNGLMERADWLTAIKTPIGVVPAGSGNALTSAIAHSVG